MIRSAARKMSRCGSRRNGKLVPEKVKDDQGREIDKPMINDATAPPGRSPGADQPLVPRSWPPSCGGRAIG